MYKMRRLILRVFVNGLSIDIIAVFTDKPYDTTVDSGSNLLWNCATTGKQSPEITWITKASVLQTGNPAHVTILPNNSLLVSGVQVKDEGLYQCQATVDSYVIAVQARLTVRGMYCRKLWNSCIRCTAESCGIPVSDVMQKFVGFLCQCSIVIVLLLRMMCRLLNVTTMTLMMLVMIQREG